jgi:ATP-binding cassette subfamily B protein
MREYVRNYYFQKVLKNPVTFFHDNMSGYLLSKINNVYTDVVNVSEDILGSFALLTIVVIVFYTFLRIDIKLGIFFMSYFIIFSTTYSLGYYKRKKLFKEVEKQDSEVVGNINDIFTNIINIKVFSKEKREKANIKKLTTKILILKNKMWNFVIPLYIYHYACVAFIIFGTFYISIDMASKKQISIGECIFILEVTFSLISKIVIFIERFTYILERMPKLQSSLETLENIPTIINYTKIPFQVTKGEIEFRNVYFKYGDNLPFIFNNINFTIKENEKVGIVGYSGGGKSTLVNLLLRFYDVSDGGIYLDNKNIKTDIMQEDLRKNITYISQEPILFHRTILENVVYGIPAKEKIDMEKVIDACKKAECYDFIINTCEGFDTIVGERGIKLSGGQRQRVTIARAILKNSRILILDEATSALDSIIEDKIQNALKELMKNKTVIVIAHRLSTLDNMDRIIVLDKGVIIEDDTKTNLLKNDKLFKNMWSIQNRI